LFVGQVISTLGTRTSSLAFPLLVLALTDSPLKAGLVGFAEAMPLLLFALPAGALVDRVDRKQLMLASDLGSLLALGSIPIALWAGSLTFPHILAAAFAQGTCFIVFDFAQSAAIPQIVPQRQLATAISLNQARTQGADLVGQPLGGLLFGISRTAPFIADAISYAASFVLVLLIRTPLQEQREPQGRTILADIGDGISWLWRQPFLRTCVFLVAGTNLVSNALVLVLIVRAKELGASPEAIGLMLGLWGLGGLAGSIVAPRLVRQLPSKAIVIGSMWLWAAGVALLALPKEPLALGAIVGLAVPPLVVWNVVLASYRYALVPDRLLGRVQSAGRLVAWSSLPLAPLAAGLLLEWGGAVKSILILALLMAVVALAGTLARPVRQAPPLKTLAAPTT
jgi:MFS family permease